MVVGIRMALRLRLIYLNVWSLVSGSVWEDVRDVRGNLTLLEEMSLGMGPN